jgi:hypothetical protein
MTLTGTASSASAATTKSAGGKKQPSPAKAHHKSAAALGPAPVVNVSFILLVLCVERKTVVVIVYLSENHYESRTVLPIAQFGFDRGSKPVLSLSFLFHLL